MSMWGLWRRYDENEMHVVPCDREGYVVGGHRCTADCWCKPIAEPDTPSLLIHNDHERGGANA